MLASPSPEEETLSSVDPVIGTDGVAKLHCESKKLGHFYFYYNFGKCRPISIIRSLLDS